MPLAKLLDWGSEQLPTLYNDNLSDFIITTLNNAVEATLAVILLIKCELKLLQATVAGVVLLHLLLIPGTAFMVNKQQNLHRVKSELNRTLLTIGLLVLLVPAGFFAAIDSGMSVSGTEGPDFVLNDTVRDGFLRMGRGFAVIMLLVYISSRFYLRKSGKSNSNAIPEPAQEIESDPKINPRACFVILFLCVSLMGVTAEFLVDSVEGVREESNISEEWFGLVLLPILSWSADGVITFTYFVRKQVREYPDRRIRRHYAEFQDAEPPTIIAEARAIELSIQFLLFWVPLLVLVGWWANKPMSVLFDLFEVIVLIGSCFLVNYVTADLAVNWSEGTMMIALYIMIALSAWFYPGQPEVRIMDACSDIADALAASAGSKE